ncbi:glycosyltransferase [Bradyrhizobium sp.]|uniref:glycosyltransferase n=1 Tax=Bradyrhizobium sp. TaxID=376 RepID=UPI0025B9253A|nr:glycosyltransferase [Bradyrhizobium sp.]
MRSVNRPFDCEFTLALNNRTGKYFFCKEMIESSEDLIAAIRYWRVPMKRPPSGLLARLLGRMARWEIDFRSGTGPLNRLLPPSPHRRPMIFTDPREVLFYRLKSCDIVVCHDMGPVTHPHLYHVGVSHIYGKAFNQIRDARPFMIFVSAASRRAFVARYGDNYPLMQVVSPPLRIDMVRREESPLAGIPENFLLTVGAVGERKNQLRAIRAFDATGLAKAGYAYVICGGLHEAGADQVVEAAKRTQGVVLPGYVNDAQLRWLYKNATGFVLPSLLEGFGLPAAEAVHHGLVPLLSRDGALQEVAGDGAIYVDPLEETEIAAGMKLLADLTREERSKRLDQLLVNVSRFSLETETGKWRETLMLAAAAWSADAAGRS